MTTFTASYSPDDNKLRLCASSRLDPNLYQRVRGAGFIWAPKQGIFIAAMWTPAREDLLLELCGEIGDEDTSLVERAEARARRFAAYGDNRSADAQRAQASVDALTAHIPLGQPILVGHHSERNARRDAARIDSGMRKTLQLWETAEYWQQRAAAALRHAKDQQRADVRHRRIKTLEAARRKEAKAIADAQAALTAWQKDGLSHAEAMAIANHSHVSRCFPLAEYPRAAPASQYEGPMGLWSALDGGVINAAQAREIALAACTRTIDHAGRWLVHYDNRLGYERAMLNQQGGIAADSGGEGGQGFAVAVGGRVWVGHEWLSVLRVNKAHGSINSVTTNRRYVPVVGIEAVDDYQAPGAEQVATVKAATRQPPLCNYPGADILPLTRAEWQQKTGGYGGASMGGVRAINGARAVRSMEGAAPHRARFLYFYAKGYPQYQQVYLSDAPLKAAPPAADTPAPATLPAPERTAPQTGHSQHATAQHATPELDAARARVNAGVTVVSAPQLFATPRALARRMVDLACPPIGARVLEPSAGSGALLQALPGVVPFSGNRQTACEVVAVEINPALAQGLRHSGLAQTVICTDFLYYAAETQFDIVLMNPPFVHAADIRHIVHALTLLRPGGRLVAICASGPRQQAALRPLVQARGGSWEDLPPDTFKQARTGVQAALLVINA